MYINTKCHFHYEQAHNKLQIIYFEQNYIQFKSIIVTGDNWSNEAKEKFKTIKNMFVYFNQHPQCVKIMKNNQPRICMQQFVGEKNNLSTIEFNLISPVPAAQILKQSLLIPSDSLIMKQTIQPNYQQTKMKKIYQQLTLKNIENLDLKKKVIELETQLKLREAEISSLKIALAMASEIKHQSEKHLHSQTLLQQHHHHLNTSVEKQTIYLSVYSPMERKSSNMNSVCSSDREMGSNHDGPSIKIIGDTKSTADRQEDKIRKSTDFPSNRFLNAKTPIRMRLLIDKAKIQQFFTVNNLRGSNKMIQKINGANIGHQVVFDNWIYKQGSSYFRFVNRGIKNNFLFVGVTIQTKTTHKNSFSSKYSVSYNCANGFIWSGCQSNKNNQLGKQLKTSQTMTVLVNCTSQTIAWFIGRRVVGCYSIQHLFSDQYKDFKLHPFIGMQGVGDKVQVMNDQDSPSLSIQNLMGQELYKKVIEKRSNILLMPTTFDDLKGKIRTKSVNFEKR